MVAFIWPLLCAGFIYLTNHAELLQGLDKEFLQFIQVDGRFFSIFMYVQAGFAVFLAALAGPGLIAPDLANNALPLYFSRPLTRWTYALARLTVLVGMLSIVTWIPGLILFGLQVGLAGGSWFRANWTLGAGMVAGFFVWLLAAEPGRDGQFRVREVARGGRGGEPGLLLHSERRRRNDRQRASGDLGAHHRSGLGGEPRLVHAAGRGGASRARRGGVGVGADGDGGCCSSWSSSASCGRWRSCR